MGSCQFILQTTLQSLAYRLARYANAHTGFYPPGFCTEAEELGPIVGKSGPSLVLYRGCTLPPAKVNAWILSGPAATAIVRVFWLGPEPSAAASPEDLLRQLVEVGPPPGGAPLRLQCFPKSLEGWLVEALPPAWELQPVGPKWVLHVVRFMPVPQQAQQAQQLTGEQWQQQHNGEQRERRQLERAQREEGEQGREQELQQQQGGGGERLLFSLQPAADLYNYPPNLGTRVPDQMCKAAGKLAEVLAATPLRLTAGTAVDLGAAPGGWTQVLARHARRVIAVDPAAMDPRVLLPNVTHLACKAEDAVEHIHTLAAGAGVDLLVSDINKHPMQVLQFLRPLLPLLRPGGALVLTLKWYGGGRGRDEWKARLLRELGPAFDRVELLWLLANTQHEQTAVAWKSVEAA